MQLSVSSIQSTVTDCQTRLQLLRSYVLVPEPFRLPYVSASLHWGDQGVPPCSTFLLTWVLGQTQVLLSMQQALYKMSHLPSPCPQFSKKVFGLWLNAQIDRVPM